MKNIAIIIIFCSLILISCGAYYDKDYYQRITGIIVPESSEVLESFDNGEFYTITCFKLEKSDMKTFLETYNFKNFKDGWMPGIFGVQNLEKERPDDNMQNCVYTANNKGKNDWIYIVDTIRQILWAEVRYPDWGGN